MVAHQIAQAQPQGVCVLKLPELAEHWRYILMHLTLTTSAAPRWSQHAAFSAGVIVLCKASATYMLTMNATDRAMILRASRANGCCSAAPVLVCVAASLVLLPCTVAAVAGHAARALLLSSLRCEYRVW
jgi:hypothetical protein